jgi:hypothetical protein
MWRKQPIATALAALHWALIAAAYGRLAAKAFLHFPTDWDFLAYHLPGALAAWGLTSYTPEPRLVAVIAGFRPASDRRGALVLVMGASRRPARWTWSVSPGSSRARLAAGVRFAALAPHGASPFTLIDLASGYPGRRRGPRQALAARDVDVAVIGERVGRAFAHHVGACCEVHDHVHPGQRLLPIGIRADIANRDDADGGSESCQGRTLAPHCAGDDRDARDRARRVADKSRRAGHQD